MERIECLAVGLSDAKFASFFRHHRCLTTTFSHFRTERTQNSFHFATSTKQSPYSERFRIRSRRSLEGGRNMRVRCDRWV